MRADDKSDCGCSDEKDDSMPTQTDLIINERLKAFQMSDISGWNRVKFGLFTADENGDFSPHTQMIFTSTFVAAIVGAAYGGFEKSKVTYLEFMRTNQATKFDSHMEAKRRLQDRVSLGFLKGGLQLGWRTGLFTFMFTSVSNTLSLYRNKDGILEYTAGGLAAGIAYRSHVGIRAVIVGGILGSALGTVTGLLNTGLLKLLGFSMSQLREANYRFSYQRSSFVNEGTAKVNREDYMENSLLMDRIEKEKETNRLPDQLKNIDLKS